MKKRKILKPLLWGLAIGSVVLCFFLFSNFQDEKPYESHYWEIITNPDKIPNATIEDVYGKPNEIVFENGIPYAKYNGISFMLYAYDTSFSDEDIFKNIQSAIITDPKYRFGSKKIGVGSTREEVEKAYKNVIKNIDIDCGYHDGIMGIDFFFDENGIVNKILIGEWP